MRFLSSKIWDLIKGVQGHLQQTTLPLKVQQEHVAILEATSDGNLDKARNAVLIHLKNAAKRRGLAILNSKTEVD